MARTRVDGNPFLDPEAPALATVIATLETAEPSPRRRGEMASGVRTVCAVLGYRPHELPADTALLGRLIRKAMPAAAGVSPSRWGNARSLLQTALMRSGLAIMPGRRLHPLAPAWAALAATLPNRYERAMLSRLMRWSSAEGIDPEHLDQLAMERFGTALMQDSFHQNPRDCWRRTVVAWNAAVEGVSGWPQQQFSPPPGRECYVLALEAFPAAFQADARAWLDRLAGKAGLDAGPIKPLRPATIDKWHFALRQLGSALVASGRDIATITRLEDLVEAADTILCFYLERSGNQPCAQTATLANHLKAIARHHVGAPALVLDRLRRIAARVTPPVQGMTDKNRGALRQFQSVEMQRKLAQLPATLFAALPASGPVGKRLAIRLQGALAVEILLVAPMRLRNLCRLELGRHLQELRDGQRSRWLITIPGDEVKNGEPIELPLPERSVRLLEIYRARILPVLGQPGRHFLFPGRKGAKAEVTLGGQIPRLLQRELGVRLSAHQFRHLIGYIYLLRHPHGHEVVRRMLGHRDIRTTIKFYAGMEMAEAARHYEAVLEELIDPKLRTGSGQNSARPASRQQATRPAGPKERAVSGPDWREPRRACLPFARWPAADREGWLAATSKGDVLLDDGPGAALKPLTLERHRCSYGRWLGFLERAGRLDPAASPGARASCEAIEAYIIDLEALNAPQTVVVRMQSLSVVLRWLAPEVDWAWLRRLVVRLEAKAGPVRDKRARLQLADALFDLGMLLTAEADNQASSTPRERAQLYRDGLMIAFLSCHPLRLTNFRLLELGRHLRRADDGWWLEVEGSETKTGQPLQFPVQARLVPLLERYLQIWRPHLASPGRVAQSRALWLTDQGRAISETHAHLRITRHTARAFGCPVNPHMFRDALATTIALARPDKIGIVTPLLGHRSLATAQRAYNLAGMATAAAAWHDALDDLSRS